MTLTRLIYLVHFILNSTSRHPGLPSHLPRPVQLPRRRCRHLGRLLGMAGVPQLVQQPHEWRQEQRREQLQLSQLKTTAKRSLLYPSYTNIPLYFCMSKAPLYIYATYYYLLCLSVFCITGRKIATYSEVKNIFRFFLLKEKCRVSISQIYMYVFL